MDWSSIPVGFMGMYLLDIFVQDVNVQIQGNRSLLIFISVFSLDALTLSRIIISTMSEMSTKKTESESYWEIEPTAVLFSTLVCTQEHITWIPHGNALAGSPTLRHHNLSHDRGRPHLKYPVISTLCQCCGSGAGSEGSICFLVLPDPSRSH
jgi:hypothetical protein